MDHGVQVNLTNEGEHQAQAERNNRTIKERIQSTFYNLPFRKLPEVLVTYLCMSCTDALNLFPAKNGICDYLSPHTIMTGKPMSFERHCTIPFGAFVQGHDSMLKSNTMAPRSLDCIYLRPTKTSQVGHELFHLDTKKVITRGYVTERPITQAVITVVENMAKHGRDYLQFGTRNNLHDAWLAGVEDDHNEDDQNNNDVEENVDEENEVNNNDENEEDEDEEDDNVDPDIGEES
jgi:hypothetical protein